MKELQCLDKRGYITLIIAIILVGTLVTNVYFAFCAQETDMYGVEKYVNFEEIDIWLAELRGTCGEIKDDSSIVSFVSNSKKVQIYEFILENQLEYGDFILSNSITNFTNNWYSYLDFVTNIMLFMLLFISLLLMLVLFNLDFQTGTYRFYYQKKHRIYLLVEKTRCFFFVILMAIGIGSMITILNGCIMFRDTSKLLLLVNIDNKMYMLTEGMYFLFTFLSMFVNLLFYVVIFWVLCLLSNTLVACLASCLYVCVTFIINSTPVSFITSDIFRGQVLAEMFSLSFIMIVCLLKIILCILAIAITCRYFADKDLG